MTKLIFAFRNFANEPKNDQKVIKLNGCKDSLMSEGMETVNLRVRTTYPDSVANEPRKSRTVIAPDSPASHVVSSRFVGINHDRSKPAY